MNDLLFYALILALLYYFFLYLPQQKSSSSNPPPQPFTHHHSTQTDPVTTNVEPDVLNCPGPEDEPELESTLDTLIKDIQAFNKELANPSLTELQQALTIASQKLAGELPWESWETKAGLTNYCQELTKKINSLTKK